MKSNSLFVIIVLFLVIGNTFRTKRESNRRSLVIEKEKEDNLRELYGQKV
jgi:hypothetical protein